MPNHTVPARAQQDRRPPDLAGQMARHDGLVHAVLRQQARGALCYEDRLQAGRIGLWRALRGYDPRRGVAFSSYAWPAIQRAIWDAVRAAERPAVVVTLAPPEPVAVEAALERAEVAAALHALVARLPAPGREVVVAYYGLGGAPGRSLRQLGRQLGLSHEAVRLRLGAALVWLRHPAQSLAVRLLVGANTAAAYQAADDRAQVWLRRRGGRRGR